MGRRAINTKNWEEAVKQLVRSLTTASAGVALAVAVMAAPVQVADVTDADILNDQATTGDVVSYGLGPQGQRYSPLDKINTETVKDLRPLWAFSFGGEKQRGQESQPLVKDGVMYVTASYSRL